MPEKLIDSKYWFHMSNGNEIRNIAELAKEYKNNIENPSTNFLSYINNKGNDFANWIDGVFGLHDLAENLRNAKTVSSAFELLENYIKSRHVKEEVETPIIEKVNIPNAEELNDAKTYTERFSDFSEKKLEDVENIKKKYNTNIYSNIEKKETLEEEYNQLYTELSNARKEGVDVFIPSLRMKNIKPKIDYFRISGSDADYNAIKKIFKTIKSELEECLNHKLPDIKAEILKEVETSKEVNNELVQEKAQ